MKVIIPGGSGQVGVVLCRALVVDGHEVVVLSRNTLAGPTGVRHVPWDGRTVGDWAREIDGADVVINLAGRSVNCRYNAANRRQIMDSRLDSTRIIGRAIAQSHRPPRVWLQASTATIYSHRFDSPNDDITGIIGSDEPNAPATWRFSIDVATSWENAANEIETPHTRTVLMRSAMTMSPDRDGIFDTLLGLVRRGLGGKSGDGEQYVSWIHEHDFVRAVHWLIEHDNVRGPVNLCSPCPIPNAVFMRDLRDAWGSKIGLPATRMMLEIGAVFLRTETELILKSRRVVPTRLLQSGFAFEHPHWPDAARELCARWRAMRAVK